MRTKRVTGKFLLIETKAGKGILNLWTDEIIAIIDSHDEGGAMVNHILVESEGNKKYLREGDVGRELVFQEIIPSIDRIVIMTYPEDAKKFKAIREQ